MEGIRRIVRPMEGKRMADATDRRGFLVVIIKASAATVGALTVLRGLQRGAFDASDERHERHERADIVQGHARC